MDVPVDTQYIIPMKDWTVDTVSQKLKAAGIPDEYIRMLKEEGISGDILMDYTSSTLAEDFPNKLKAGPRRAILKARDQYVKEEQCERLQLQDPIQQNPTKSSVAKTNIKLHTGEVKQSSTMTTHSGNPDIDRREIKEARSNMQDKHLDRSLQNLKLPSSSQSIQLEQSNTMTTHHEMPDIDRREAGAAKLSSSTQPEKTAETNDTTSTYGKATEVPPKTHQPKSSVNADQPSVVIESKVDKGRKHGKAASASGDTKEMFKKREKNLRKLLLGAKQQQLDQSYYPVLFSNKPTESFQPQSFEFINHIDWTAVFDFDSESNDRGLCHEYCKERKPNLQLPNTVKDHANLESDTTSWIFCNGRSDIKFDVLPRSQWHQKWREHVEDVITGYKKVIPKDRGVLIFLVHSDDNIGVLADTFSKVFSTFHGAATITCIIESEDLYSRWAEEVTRTYCCTADALKARSIVGMNWKDVNIVLQRMANVNRKSEDNLPYYQQRSIFLTPRMKSSWQRIQVLVQNETENMDMDEDNPEFEKLKTTKETRFYRGHKVDWWNFALTDKKYNQVLRRAGSKDLFAKVNEALLDKDGNIKEVSIFHQAGSGGSTMGRQVLWDVHKQYRCAIVKSVSITDMRTAEEILELRMYGYEYDKRSSMPVVVLADDLEQSDVDKLRNDLEFCSRDLKVGGPLCVIVHCRRTSDPVATLAKESSEESSDCVGVTVFHQLQSFEQAWFQDKYEELEAKSAGNVLSSPENLLGFMILKEECSPEYIHGVATKAIADLKDNYPKEFELLKYTAILNKYDPNGGIPVTACDTLFHGNSLYMGEEFKHWEHQLSASSNLLMIREKTFVPHHSSIMAMKLVGQNVAKVVVDILCENQTLADLVLEFLNSEVMMATTASRERHLKPQVRNLLFQRDLESHEDFSPMIEEITADSKEKALEIFDTAYKNLEEPFCGQHAARLLYLKDNKYDQAHQYIDRALADKPHNLSYLWSTKGQIYKKQINEEFTKVYLKKNQPVRTLHMEAATRLVTLTFAAIDAYRESQKASQKEKQTTYTGYTGEADVSLQMLEILQKCMVVFQSEDQEVFHNYLGTDEIPEELISEWSMFHSKFKGLKSKIEQALNHIDGQGTYFKQSSGLTAVPVFQRKESKVKIDRQYQRVFGRPYRSKPPRRHSDKAEWNRGRVIELGSDRFHDIFELVKVNKTENIQKLQQALSITLENNPPNHTDLMRTICISLALSSASDESKEQLMSANELYDKAQQLRDKSYSSDIYGPFFVLMFVWPHPTCPSYRIRKNEIKHYISDLQRAYKASKSAYYNEEAPSGSSVKPATFFFLANGKGLKQFTHIHELNATRRQVESDRDKFWQTPVVKKKLIQLRGVLYNSSTLMYQTPFGDSLEIVLSKPRMSVSQEEVTFYLGFSWGGPVAYYVNYVDKSRPSSLEGFDSLQREHLFQRHEHDKELYNLLEQEKALKLLEDDKQKGRPLTYKEVSTIFSRSFLFSKCIETNTWFSFLQILC